MNGFLNHLATTLRLILRNRQALIFSYIFPMVFLVMFAMLPQSDRFSLRLTLGQLLTMTMLGASLFGLPISFVVERERGLWRRYRLAPLAPGWFVASALLSRFVILVTSALLQIAVAVTVFHMSIPNQPVELLIAFTFSAFAYMGIGLIIAMLADSAASVQAMSQSLFLPMMFLGVAFPLWFLPPAAQVAALFFPSRYSTELMRGCITGLNGLESTEAIYSLVALALMGGTACLVAAKLFRWETNQPQRPRAIAWLAVVLGLWLVIGLGARQLGFVQVKP